MKMTEKVAA